MKYYFTELDDEQCYPLRIIKNDAREENLSEIEVTEAKRVTGQGYFYCIKLEVSGEIGEKMCGRRICKSYSPRNGRSGRCRYYTYYYEKTDKKRVIKIKSNDKEQDKTR